MTSSKPNNYKIALIVFSLVVLIFTITVLFVKDMRHGYNGLDLAIYNQVMWNSSQGDLFSFTLHPHSYLGDHLEFILLLLLPFYWLWQQPFTLILLQTIFLIMAVWPLWLIARQKLSERWAFIIGLAWLFSPFLHNINSFEFHALALTPFFIFWAIFFYLKSRWWPFLAFILLSLSIREDVSLVILAFSFLAFIDKRSWRWRLVPVILGVIWFVISLKLSPVLTGYQQYKFLAYYGWLGNSPSEMLLTFINNPLYVLKNIITIKTFTLLFGLLMPFLFLPLFRPKYLLLILLPIIQLILLQNPGELTLQIHYTAPLIAPIFIALVYSIIYLQDKKRGSFIRFFGSEPGLIQSIVLAASIGGLLFMGPYFSSIKEINHTSNLTEEIQLKKDFISLVPSTDSVASGYYFLTELSGRQRVYSLHYQFLGSKQYSEIPYNVPTDTDWALVNSDDSLIYHVTYEETDKKNSSGDDRLRMFLAEDQRGIVKMIDKYVLYQRGEKSNFEPFNVLERLPEENIATSQVLSPHIESLGWLGHDGKPELVMAKELINTNSYNTLPLTLYWRTTDAPDRDYNIKLSLIRDGRTIHQERYAMAFGLYPTTNWQPGEIIATSYRFLLPQRLGSLDGTQVEITVELLDGNLWFDDWRGVAPYYSAVEVIGQPIIIGQL
ncbi:DUF2079 domain-containing protein [Patescibacteria group bacterium]